MIALSASLLEDEEEEEEGKAVCMNSPPRICMHPPRQ
jgi:septum formation inhibitor MinC